MIYRIENSDRIYDGLQYDALGTTYSEIQVHLEQYIASGYKIFYLQRLSKLKLALNESELTYLRTLYIR